MVNGKWNGLVAELINHETDIVLTSLKINSGRERVIDFRWVSTLQNSSNKNSSTMLVYCYTATMGPYHG